MMLVDISMYQTGLVLDDLPQTVSGVIIKASQGTWEDPAFPVFIAQARASERFKWIGFYHFLSDRGVDNEAAHFLDAIDSVGGLRDGEFAVLDWENNAITSYQPPMSDALTWMLMVDYALPGRVAWYSYRYNANKARASGDFPWPLWLSDPNPDGPAWAQTLNAFLLQSGQQTLANINIDVNDIIDISVLDALGYPMGNSSPLEDDMPTAQEVAKAMLDELVPSHDYDTGTNSDIPLRVAIGNASSELSLIRHHLTGAPVK